MLETPQERVDLLKAGISVKTMEKLYLICNNFKIVKSPVLYEPSEKKAHESKKNFFRREVRAQPDEVVG
jgi:hypothetical protein